VAQGWTVNASADTITFLEPPVAGVNNIVVSEYATATLNATAVFRLGAWSALYGYPSEVEFFADRLALAATLEQPQTLWLSRIADYSFFGRSTPILDDDAISSTLNARQLNRIVDLLPKQHLLALTTGGVWKIGGGDSEVLTPSTIASRPQPAAGASNLPALDVGETAVYLTKQSGEVRDLAFTFEADGYAGSDLTAFASHLLRNRTIVDWTHQAVPYSAIYAVRDDGLMLTLTYKREHQVVAWARHVTDGVYESVASIPEGSVNAVYAIVRRTINGVQRRYVERFSQPMRDRREWVGLDSALTYDGRNTAATTMALSAADWDGEVTVTSSASFFVLSNEGDAVVLDYDGTPLHLHITDYVSATVVKAQPSRTVPESLRTPGARWALAVDTVSGLGHLEGKLAGVAADGHDYEPKIVVGGVVQLAAPGVLIHVGLPYVCDYQSLDLSLAGQEPIGTRSKLIKQLGVLVHETQTLQAGTDFGILEELKPRDQEQLGLPPDVKSEWLLFDVHGVWQKAPRICVRHTSAYPATILAIEADPDIGT